MAAWLRGYLAGKSSVDAVRYRRRCAATPLALKRYCQNHPTVGLISAAGKWGH